jgi:hypothetical protein
LSSANAFNSSFPLPLSIQWRYVKLSVFTFQLFIFINESKTGNCKYDWLFTFFEYLHWISSILLQVDLSVPKKPLVFFNVDKNPFYPIRKWTLSHLTLNSNIPIIISNIVSLQLQTFQDAIYNIWILLLSEFAFKNTLKIRVWLCNVPWWVHKKLSTFNVGKSSINVIKQNEPPQCETFRLIVKGWTISIANLELQMDVRFNRASMSSCQI